MKGSRAIKDVDLATLYGIGLPEFYKRLGNKLWRFAPTLIGGVPVKVTGTISFKFTLY